MIDFADSANGLVWLVIDVYNIILWNPSTRDAKELPKPKLIPKFPEPSDEFDGVFGLGYDSSTDDFKVVRLTHYVISSRFIKTKGEVFTLKTNSRRRIQNIHHGADMLSGRGNFSNGSLHWLVDRGNGEDRLKSIVSFDLATEIFQEVVPLPDHDVKASSIKIFMVLGGNLSVLYRYANDFEVWVMKEYGVKTSWTKVVTIPSEKAPPYLGPPWLLPLCFSRSNEILMDLCGRELVMYNLKEETFRKLSIYGDSWDILDPVIYVGSLVSPTGNYGTNKQRRGQQRGEEKNEE